VNATVFAVFVLGLRHGADPDHVAAIDNLTRNSAGARPLLSRFCGAIFAGGHSLMILAIAAIVGIAGTSLNAYGDRIELAGTWLSIVILIALGVANLIALRSGATGFSGLRTRLLPKRLRAATNPWMALPVGLLFGIGFETSSQIAAYTLAFGARGGVIGALLIGAAFCAGMIVTDTLDSVVVHRLVADRSVAVPAAAKTWVWSVTLIAFAIAGVELLDVTGHPLPLPEIYISYATVAVLAVVFVVLFVRTRTVRDALVPAKQPTHL
jgi:high-affinity nickel-transport protein